MSASSYDPEARSAARLGAIQALFQMDSAETPVDGVIAEFRDFRFGEDVDGVHLPEGDVDYFESILRGTVENQVAVDRAANGVLAEGWKLNRLDTTVRAIVRAATYEILYKDDVPPKVIIAEYVRLAESFFDVDEVRFVNGALDRLARENRASEMNAEGNG